MSRVTETTATRRRPRAARAGRARRTGSANRTQAAVGTDVARRHRDRRGADGHAPGRRWLLLALAAGVVAALGVAAMRNDLRRVQYGLGQALDETRALERERNAALARVRTQRDPARLARVAKERGFVRPERIIDLPAPPPARVSEGPR
ncbi:MAG: hypothetical protein QNK04_13405 [Myxococcota bacterium]|nr:hypothetical protein [Myxococcota bacterium]